MSASTGQASGAHQAELPVQEPTVGRLVADASGHVSTLLRSEIALAKSELKVSVTAGGIGAALLAVAAFLLGLGVVMLSAAFAYALTRWFEIGLDWAFLGVFGVYLVLALVCALVGLRSLKRVSAPERTIETSRDTLTALRRR